MNFRNLTLALAAGLSFCALPAPATAKELVADALTKSLMKKAEFVDIAISPDGTKLALARRIGESVGVTVHERVGLKPLITFDSGANGAITHLVFIDNERLLIGVTTMSTRDGYAEASPNLMIVTLDGKAPELLPWDFWGVIDDDKDHLLVRGCGFGKGNKGCNLPQIRRDAIGSLTKKGDLVIEGPPDSRMTLNRSASTGFATKGEDDGTVKTYVYKPADKTWTLLNDSAVTGVEVYPYGVARDGKTGFLGTERKDGPDVIEKYDFTTGQRTPVHADAHSDPMYTLLSLDLNDAVGAMYDPTDPRFYSWNPTHPDAVLYTQLFAAFPGQHVSVVDMSKDRNILVLDVSSDRDPGTWYIFDRKALKATPITRQHPWIDPKTQAPQRSIELTSRDGKLLHGLLTLPPGSSGKNLPLVVTPHGGPYWVHDSKGYDVDNQVLAQHGYAVLQVNFRGSDSYGLSFHEAGVRQWGRAMQDDITDATKWVVAQGIADGNRICIAGVSYGAYAAMMGAVREPNLYKCAAAYAGPFDLGKMTNWDRGDRDELSKKWIAKNIGEGEYLVPVSPNLQADKIKVPVLIAQGYRDARVGVRHAQAMRDALEKNRVPVDYIEYSDTGHFLLLQQHREDFYTRLLRLLDQTIGTPGKATASN